MGTSEVLRVALKSIIIGNNLEGESAQYESRGMDDESHEDFDTR